ncbi:hypothetical protein BZG36_02973 [Bifiguratus adelaidae]|uniref:Cation/H+ exchanger transmembrane domain-containing protein n=1 Tax=Bifiguratus adelaidae TaxID=1938954 RepID=A0A261Y0R0_9FUNG|nr:hypothetical protein BZG36_02973 [Bifiguratus adelaidae]
MAGFGDEVDTFNIALAVLSGFVTIFGLVSLLIKEKLFISEAFVAIVIGIIAGPLAANVVDPLAWGNTDAITTEFTRVVIAIQVMAVGIDLPKHYMKKEALSMFMMLIPVMTWMWLVSATIIYLLIPPLRFLEALVIATCVTPTDPVDSPKSTYQRTLDISCRQKDTGVNDGMGFPFLYIAIYLLQYPDNVGTAVGKWFYFTWLFQIGGSCVIGLVVGFISRKILQFCEDRNLIDKPSFLVFSIALALFIMSCVGMSGSDDLLACFVAGCSLSWDDWFRKETDEAHIQDVIDMMLNLAMFVYIGTIIPWHSFGDAALGLSPWRLVVIAILILLFRRLPIVVALKPIIPAVKTYREAVFTGWFGPMGVGAVFFTVLAKTELEQYAQERPEAVESIQVVVLFIVLASVLIHGTTIPMVKIGKRIRTRTMSISSASNQVTRLPKIQFGQTLSFRKDTEKRGSSDQFNMSIRPSSTLGRYNQPHGPTATRFPTENVNDEDNESIAIDMDNDYSEGATAVEEGESSSRQNSRQNTESSFQGYTHRGSSGQDPSEDASQSIATTVPGGTEGTGASIRFLEPINPRLSMYGADNESQNERSATSLREFLGRGRRSGQASNIDPSQNVKDNERSVSSLRDLFSPKSRSQKSENDDAESANNISDNEDTTRSLSNLFNFKGKGSKEAAPRSVRDVFSQAANSVKSEGRAEAREADDDDLKEEHWRRDPKYKEHHKRPKIVPESETEAPHEPFPVAGEIGSPESGDADKVVESTSSGGDVETKASLDPSYPDRGPRKSHHHKFLHVSPPSTPASQDTTWDENSHIIRECRDGTVEVTDKSGTPVDDSLLSELAKKLHHLEGKRSHSNG